MEGGVAGWIRTVEEVAPSATDAMASADGMRRPARSVTTASSEPSCTVPIRVSCGSMVHVAKAPVLSSAASASWGRKAQSKGGATSRMRRGSCRPSIWRTAVMLAGGGIDSSPSAETNFSK